MNVKNFVYTVVIGLYLTLSGLPCLARDYYIDSQQRFDTYRTESFRPGDKILFMRGVQFYGMFAPSGNGTEQAPIIIDGYGDGNRPCINALGKHAAGLFLKNVSYWEVNGLEVTNTNGSDDDQGDLFGIYVLAEGMEKTFRHVYINDCHVHDVNGKVAGKRRGGIHVHVKESDTATFDDLRITNNRVAFVGGVGIGNASSCGDVEFLDDGRVIEHHLWTNVYVAGNTVESSGRNAIIARVSKNAVYEHNVLANSSRYSTGHSIFCFDTSGITIQYNEAYGNVGPGGIDRGGFDADYNCINTVIQYNYSHDNNWFCGIMKKHNRNVIIRYNISQNDREAIYRYGFESETLAEGIHIYNNTHYVRAGLDVDVFSEGRTPLNSLFENNIFYFEGKGQWGKNAAGINTHFNNNLYYGITPHESDDRPVRTNPLFIRGGSGGLGINTLDGYQLQANSTAINAGEAIASMPDVDFWGNIIPLDRQIDIGAHEFRIVESTLPDGWQNQDIGATGPVGGADFDKGIIAVRGSGKGLYQAIDNFHYVYRSLSGDGTITAQCLSIEQDTEKQATGMMLRESTEPVAPYALIRVSPKGGIYFQYTSDGEQQLTTLFTDGFQEGLTAHGWDNQGVYWSSTAYAENPRSAKFDRTESLTNRISTVGYQQIHLSYAIKGKDTNVGDRFFAEWHDGVKWHLIEEVTALSRDWSFREFNLPAAAADNPDFRLRFRVDADPTHYAYVDVVTINGISSGRSIKMTMIAGPPPPCWFRLVRTRNRVTGYYSEDGEKWNRIDSITIGMDQDVLAGLVVSSGDGQTMNEAWFDNVFVVDED